VSGRWEDIDEASEGRRRRRYHRLTEVGRDMATDLVSSLATLLARPVAAALTSKDGLR
jgi:DNA-binding MarR family transcriptional regulator